MSSFISELVTNDFSLSLVVVVLSFFSLYFSLIIIFWNNSRLNRLERERERRNGFHSQINKKISRLIFGFYKTQFDLYIQFKKARDRFEIRNGIEILQMEIISYIQVTLQKKKRESNRTKLIDIDLYRSFFFECIFISANIYT